MRWTQKLMREVAQEERSGLGLSSREPLDPYDLAREHGIPVYSLADCVASGLRSVVFEHFAERKAGTWSAMLLPLGSRRVIVENEKHQLVRRRSNIAHELGHHLLEHEFDQVLLGEDHKRAFDDAREKQAKFMSGELLIPLDAAQRMAYDGWDNTRVATAFGVSEQFAQMQMMGPRVRADRAAKKFRFA